MSERRSWAGYFRSCPSCAKRNWVGRVSCTACGTSLLTVPAEGGEPPGQWRRGGDRFGGRRLAWTLGAAVVLATGSAFLVRHVLRADPARLVEPDGEVTQIEVPAQPEPAMVPPTLDPAATLADREAFEQGRKLLERGDVRASLRPLTRAVAAFPEDALVTHTYGLALWRAGSRDRALFHLEKAVLLAPGAASYHVTLALALAGAGRRERAMREYQTAYELDPANAAAAEALAAYGFPAAPDSFARVGFDGAATGAPGGGGSVHLGGSSRQPLPASGSSRRAFTDEDLRAYRAGSATASSPPRE